MPVGRPAVSLADIQAAGSLAGLQQLLGRLGYDVSEPVEQSAVSLGFAERVHHLVRQARRVAAKRLAPGLSPALEVYCLEVTNLTADLRKAVTTAFRNKPVNALFILTTRDYDPLDFVLVQKDVGATQAPSGQVIVSYRLLSVDRRHPTAVHLRVLARMSDTAADPYAQYERMRDAFRLAEWSEDEFNNRNLFSDYFLKQRLTKPQLFPVWNTDVRPAHRELARIYAEAGDVHDLNAEQFQAKLIKPCLDVLGFDGQATSGADAEADILLKSKGEKDAAPCAALLVYPWDRPLDRQDDLNRDRANHVPGIRVIRAMEQHQLPWAIVTNGKDWRLYSAHAHSRASNYYEVDLPEALSGDDLLAFRYFHLFFRAEAFVPAGQAPCFLDQMRQGSEAFAREIGEHLRERIFDEVFPYLAQGFVDYHEQKTGAKPAAGDPFLNEVYDATLTLLYRLLFLLYAESLDLLPVNEPAYAALSLGRLKQEIKDAAGSDADAVEERLKKRYTKDETRLYQDLNKLFDAIAGGSKEHNVPAYNGGLFRTTPDKDDRSRDAAAARFLNKQRVPDFYLARALDLLARIEDPKTHELVFVDYKALGVRQLGNIYEGLLMYHVVIPHDEWERGYRRKGLKIALTPSNKERKSTGSYFTPQHIVKYIVSNTVGPLLAEKFAAAEPRLRAAQREFSDTRTFERKRETKVGVAPRSDDAIAESIMLKYEGAVWELFDLKVRDPAMGSGHFLVETVDFITDRILDFLAGFPWNPVQVLIDRRIRRQIVDSLEKQEIKINEDRLTDVNLIKRLVMKRCVYGVDLNPMAVELAKVSLWLDSFKLGAPLSFLDHHLKCGNSLIGATIEDLKKATKDWMYSVPMEPLERATRNMEKIADLSDATVMEVAQSADTYKEVLHGVHGYRALLDCLTAEHFGVEGSAALVTQGSELDVERWEHSVRALPTEEKRFVGEAESKSKEREFFHWDVDFPDVFFTPRRPIDQRRFDAVIGNPPYDRLVGADLGEEIEMDKSYFRLANRFESSSSKEMNLWRLFIGQVLGLPRSARRFGMIIPLGLLADDSAADLRKQMLQYIAICHVEAFPQKDDPRDRVFEEAKLSTMIFVAEPRVPEPAEFVQIRTHPGKWILDDSPSYQEHQRAFLDFEPQNCPIPRCSEVEWRLAKRLTSERQLSEARICKMKDVAHHFEGEVPQKKPLGIFGKPGDGPQVLRGAHIGRYFLQDAKQGDELFVLLDRFLGKVGKKDNRISHVKTRRIVYQEGAPEDNYRRIIPTLIPEGRYVGHTVHYVPANECSYSLGALLALFASSFSEWFFDLVSSNNHVSQYKVNAFPLPTFRVSRKDKTFVQGTTVIDDALRATPDEEGYWGQTSHDALSSLGEQICSLGDEFCRERDDYRSELSGIVQTLHLEELEGAAVQRDVDYLGWDARYPSWRPAAETVADGRWYANGVAPPLAGNGPGDIPWDLIARVYPSYPLPGIDAAAWEAAAWEELCDLLRKNKNKIGNSRIRADLTGRGAVTAPTGPLRQLRETFLAHHRQIRANRARAAELDFLIDRIVFRLFDLTPDEQKLILSRVGPGRPLPPRRRRRVNRVD